MVTRSVSEGRSGFPALTLRVTKQGQMNLTELVRAGRSSHAVRLQIRFDQLMIPWLFACRIDRFQFGYQTPVVPAQTVVDNKLEQLRPLAHELMVGGCDAIARNSLIEITVQS